MKTLFLIFATLMFVSCSKDDDFVASYNFDVDESEEQYSDIVLKEGITFEQGFSTRLTFQDVQNLKAGDSIITIEAIITSGELVFEITSETFPDAFKIDSKTGVISVKDLDVLKSFPGNVIHMGLKLSNGNKTKYTGITIYIEQDTRCGDSKSEQYFLQNKWFEANKLIADFIPVKTYQITFSVTEAKTMCAFKLSSRFGPNFDKAQIANVQLMDNRDELLFNKDSYSNFMDFWGDEYYYFNEIENVDVPLVKDAVYTLLITFSDANNLAGENETVSDYYDGCPLNFQVNPEGESLNLPVTWGALKVLSTNYTTGKGEVVENKAFPLFAIGLY